jgi:hypothetical protein
LRTAFPTEAPFEQIGERLVVRMAFYPKAHAVKMRAGRAIIIGIAAGAIADGAQA